MPVDKIALAILPQIFHKNRKVIQGLKEAISAELPSFEYMELFSESNNKKFGLSAENIIRNQFGLNISGTTLYDALLVLEGKQYRIEIKCNRMIEKAKEGHFIDRALEFNDNQVKRNCLNKAQKTSLIDIYGRVNNHQLNMVDLDNFDFIFCGSFFKNCCVVYVLPSKHIKDQLVPFRDQGRNKNIDIIQLVRQDYFLCVFNSKTNLTTQTLLLNKLKQYA